MSSCTSNTPAHETNHLESSVYWQHERTPAVTLTAVFSSILVASTQEVLRIDPLLSCSLLEP